MELEQKDILLIGNQKVALGTFTNKPFIIKVLRMFYDTAKRLGLIIATLFTTLYCVLSQKSPAVMGASAGMDDAAAAAGPDGAALLARGRGGTTGARSPVPAHVRIRIASPLHVELVFIGRPDSFKILQNSV